MTKPHITSIVLLIASLLSGPTFAQDTNQVTTTQTNAVEMTVGEIRKVDLENKKITIKHGEIKNLDMPSMTMVFQVKDSALLDKVKAGDKVKFSAEKIAGAMVVTEIQATN